MTGFHTLFSTTFGAVLLCAMGSACSEGISQPVAPPAIHPAPTLSVEPTAAAPAPAPLPDDKSAPAAKACTKPVSIRCSDVRRVACGVFQVPHGGPARKLGFKDTTTIAVDDRALYILQLNTSPARPLGTSLSLHALRKPALSKPRVVARMRPGGMLVPVVAQTEDTLLIATGRRLMAVRKTGQTKKLAPLGGGQTHVAIVGDDAYFYENGRGVIEAVPMSGGAVRAVARVDIEDMVGDDSGLYFVDVSKRLAVIRNGREETLGNAPGFRGPLMIAGDELRWRAVRDRESLIVVVAASDGRARTETKPRVELGPRAVAVAGVTYFLGNHSVERFENGSHCTVVRTNGPIRALTADADAIYVAIGRQTMLEI